MRPAFTRFALASLTLLACNSSAPESAKKDAPVEAANAPAPEGQTPPPASETKTAGDPTQPPAGDVKAPEGDDKPAEGDAAKPAEGDDKPAEGDAAKPAEGDAKAPEAEAPAAPEAPAEAPAAPDPAAAIKKLLDEVKAKKTTDARAKKALEEAEKAGASVRELAAAANARGEALFSEPERAASFFTWAKDKDKTYPEPVFNLAKQSANAGEIPQTVELLKEVSKRGGKTLLKQVDFDPTFEIVKDDSEVQKLSK